MIYDSITITCDGPGCTSQITCSASSGVTAAYLDAQGAGWIIDRRITKPWRHYCGIECKQAREAK